MKYSAPNHHGYWSIYFVHLLASLASHQLLSVLFSSESGRVETPMERRSRVWRGRRWLAPLQAVAVGGAGEGRAEEGHGDEPSHPPAGNKSIV